MVISALAHSGLSPRRLELEITEGASCSRRPRRSATLHQLRELGVSIALDDFGTGYSSLSYLQRFPFDKIKIDRSFVKDLVATPTASRSCAAISGLGRSLNITTTAEGVETTDQLDWLRAEGCNEVGVCGERGSGGGGGREGWGVWVRGSRRRRKSSRVPDKAGLTCA